MKRPAGVFLFAAITLGFAFGAPMQRRPWNDFKSDK